MTLKSNAHDKRIQSYSIVAKPFDIGGRRC